MKKLILLALLLVFAVAPAMAGDFQALSNLSAPGQMALNTMTDEQLAVVEGAQVEQDIEQELEDVKIDAELTSVIVQSIKCDRGSCDQGGTVFNAATVNQSVSVSQAAANVNSN